MGNHFQNHGISDRVETDANRRGDHNSQRGCDPGHGFLSVAVRLNAFGYRENHTTPAARRKRLGARRRGNFTDYVDALRLGKPCRREFSIRQTLRLSGHRLQQFDERFGDGLMLGVRLGKRGKNFFTTDQAGHDARVTVEDCADGQIAQAAGQDAVGGDG